MTTIILKLTILFLAILAPMFRRQSGKEQMHILKRHSSELSQHAVDQDGCLVHRQLISNSNN